MAKTSLLNFKAYIAFHHGIKHLKHIGFLKRRYNLFVIIDIEKNVQFNPKLSTRIFYANLTTNQ